MNTEEKKVEEGYTIKGADEATLNYVKENSSFTDVLSDDAKNRQEKADNALSNAENIAGKDKLVSDDTWKKINATFKAPAAVREADNYLKGALSKIQSGKTSYSNQVRDMMSQIQNRDKFSYDVDSDPLFQQALASAMNSGKSAMQDTIGQASALTGGYGSSYATSAANQAYNSFVEDAYNNLPQYYQMALEAYQMEGDEMYRQLDMLNTADATEYGRLLNAYDATYSHRNQMYNEAYQQFRDSKTDAIAGANLALSEHGQLASDAFNLYSAYASEANTAYNREYQQWSDTINNAWKAIGVQNSDYWETEKSKENQRQFNLTHGDTDGDGKLSPAEVEAYDKYLKEQAQKEWDYKYATLGEDQRQFNITHGDVDGDGELSELEIQTYNAKQVAEGNYEGYINSDDIEVDENGNIISIKGYNIAGTNSAKITTIDGFLTDEGNNFEVTLGDKNYKVENKGIVDDSNIKNRLENAPSYGPIVIYENNAYLKYGTDYYKLGNQAFKSGYNDLLLALQY